MSSPGQEQRALQQEVPSHFVFTEEKKQVTLPRVSIHLAYSPSSCLHQQWGAVCAYVEDQARVSAFD